MSSLLSIGTRLHTRMASEKILEKLRHSLRPIGDSDARAAVVVLLKEETGDLQIFLVKRATNPEDPWSGNMALPGGRRHPEDQNLMDTVIRETWEETGIDLHKHNFLGTLNPVASSGASTRLVVLPFVAIYRETPEVRLNKELRDYFWYPLSRLRSSEGKAVVEGHEVPAFLVNSEIVWGLTYRMLKNLLDLVQRQC